MRNFVLVILLSCSAVASLAQQLRNELGLKLGAEFPSAETVSVPVFELGDPSAVTYSQDAGIVYGVDYAHRFFGNGNTGLWLELPFSAAPDHGIRAGEDTRSPHVISEATLFITPGFRVKFAQQHTLSPFVAVGGGYGLYEGSRRLSNGDSTFAPGRLTSTGALQWGAGLDAKTPFHLLVPIGLRIEVRDFYTLNTVNFGTGRGRSQHNVQVNGGITLRW